MSNNNWLVQTCLNEGNDIVNKVFIVRYIDKSDRSAEDRVYAKDANDAKKQVKSRAYRILSVEEEK